MLAAPYPGFTSVASPWLEAGAYEALWLRGGVTGVRDVAQMCGQPRGVPLSDLVPADQAHSCAEALARVLDSGQAGSAGIRLRQDGGLPDCLGDAADPVPLLYQRGRWELVTRPSVAVIGTRTPSPEGRARTRRLVRDLVGHGFVVVSGLARGVDAEAHQTTLRTGGETIAVIGTPIRQCYPREHRALQEHLAREHLVVSHVPVLRHQRQGPAKNRRFFLERNVTMSALSRATVIVEAGERSGTHAQARAALAQGRKLFILDSCFRQGMRWAERFERQGAIRVRTCEDIFAHLC